MTAALVVAPLAFGVLGALPVWPAGAAWAAESEDSAVVGKITMLNRRAIEEYQSLDFDEAQKLLTEALDMASKSGLAQHPIRARTYVTLGVVTLGGLKQREAAIKYFRKALQIQPEIKLSRGLANPEIQAAFDEAVTGLGSEPKDSPILPPEKLLVHDSVAAANQGQAIPIAVAPDRSLSLDTMILAYRPAGVVSFADVRMHPQSSGGVYEAAIPASATTGGHVAYYIEARRADGTSLASRGTAANPLVVTLTVGLPVAGGIPDVGVTKAGEDGEGRFFFALTAGTGAGWMKGAGEQTNLSVEHPGIAWAKAAHLAPQIGYFVTPQLLIAVQGRFQIVSGTKEYQPPTGPSPDECGGDGVCTPASGAVAGFVKAARFFGDGKSAFRPYVSLSVGGGSIRYVTNFAGAPYCGSTGTQACVDTVAVGPLLVGPGAGFFFQLSRTVGLVVELEAIVGAPTVTVHGDANIGAAFTF